MIKLNKLTTAVVVTSMSVAAASYAVEVQDTNSTTASTNSSSTLKNVIPDSVITAEVKAKLLADPVAEGLDIGVTTKNGHVVLDGKVSSKDVINAAKNVVSQVKGVISVDTAKIKVVAHKSSIGNLIPDSVITDEIKIKLLADDKVKGLDIHVSTVNGVVTLKGSNITSEMANQAIAIANKVDGVKKVISELK